MESTDTMQCEAIPFFLPIHTFTIDISNGSILYITRDGVRADEPAVLVQAVYKMCKMAKLDEAHTLLENAGAK